METATNLLDKNKLNFFAGYYVKNE